MLYTITYNCGRVILITADLSSKQGRTQEGTGVLALQWLHDSPQLTSCRRRAATVCLAPLLPRGRRSAFHRRADDNVAAVSHGQHVLAPTAADA